MAKRKTRAVKKRVTKKQCSEHDWRDPVWTYTHWFEIGNAYKVHRACKKCATIEWMKVFPSEGESESVQSKVERYISEITSKKTASV